jgi:hypothetical protein
MLQGKMHRQIIPKKCSKFERVNTISMLWTTKRWMQVKRTCDDVYKTLLLLIQVEVYALMITNSLSDISPYRLQCSPSSP